MPTRLEIVGAARLYLGTPFRHQGRVRGRGIDCAGLVIGVAHDLGISRFQHRAYGRLPHNGMLRKLLDEHAVRREGDVLGSIILMRFSPGEDEQHLGIVSDIGVIHAYSLIGKCVEHIIDETWRARITGAWDFPGMA